jgi:hypothetical protein
MAAIFTTVEERNRVLSDLAASDAFHDFGNTGRLSEENKKLGENAMPKIWAQTREIGTVQTPRGYGDEEATFERIIGKPLSEFRKVHKDARELVILAGPGVRDTIEYEWQTIEVSTRLADGSYRYTDSAELFRAITGGGSDPFYFMIDAINVNFYAALIESKGAKIGDAFYITTRERTNDSAGNRDLRGYVERSKDSRVRLGILRDESDMRTTYSVMGVASTDPTSLFNSIYTVTLENRTTSKTKEGLESSVLTFKRTSGAAIKTITSQAGTVDHGNSVNSLYGRLVNFLKKLVKNDDALEDYFTALQQKRSGDWLQVLSTFLRSRYGTALEPGVPIYLASEDRLCILYGLLTGANMIYTHQSGDKGFITIFRRKQKRTAAEKAAERLAAYQRVLRDILGEEEPGKPAKNLATAPIVPGGMPFNTACVLYMSFLTTKIGEFSAAVAKSREAALAIAAAAPGRRFDVTAFDAALKEALLPLYKLVLFVRAFNMNFLALADVSLTFAQLNKTQLKVHAPKIDAWQSVAATLRGMFATMPTALNSPEEFQTAATQLYTIFETSNRDADSALKGLTGAQPLYEQEELAIVQQISTFCPARLLAPLQPLFAAMLASANGALAGGADTKTRERALTLRMNAAILEYMLLAEATNFPAAAIPSFSAVLAKTFERSVAKPKGNLFAVHRILAASYKNFVQSQERKSLIETFLKVYRGSGGAAKGGARSRAVSKSGAASYKKTLVALSRLFAKPTGRRSTKRSASTSLERKYKRDELAGGRMSSLIPLYLVAHVLEDYAVYKDIQPYECVPRLQGLLAALLAPEFVERAHKMLAPAVPFGLFLGFYAEVVGYFVFVGLPSVSRYRGPWSNTTTYAQGDLVLGELADKYYVSLQNSNTGNIPSTSGTYWGPIVSGTVQVSRSALVSQQFSGFYGPDVEELGLLLRDGILGDVPVVLEPGLDAELMGFMGRVFSLRSAAVGAEKLSRSIILNLRSLEGYQQKTGGTPSPNRGVTRRKSKSATLVASALAAHRSRMKTAKKSGRKASGRKVSDRKPLTAIREDATGAMEA